MVACRDPQLARRWNYALDSAYVNQAIRRVASSTVALSLVFALAAARPRRNIIAPETGYGI